MLTRAWRRESTVIRHLAPFSASEPDDAPRVFEAPGRHREIPPVARREVTTDEKRDAPPCEIDAARHAGCEAEADLAAHEAHPIRDEGAEIVPAPRGPRRVVDHTAPGS